jgi:hypothetical protein
MKRLSLVLCFLLVLYKASASLNLSVRDGRLYNGRALFNIVSLDPSLGMLAEPQLTDQAGQVFEDNFDYVGFFRKCRENNINATRLFLTYHWANNLVTVEGLPKGRRDTDRRSRHTMRLSGRLFDRLKDIARVADSNDVAVIIVLFDGVALESGADDSFGNRWQNNPFNSRNNTGQALSKPRDFFGSGFRPFLKSIVDSTLAAVAGRNNVIFEIFNEPFSSMGYNTQENDAVLTAFHQDIAGHLDRRFRDRGYRSPIMVNPPKGSGMPKLVSWASTSPSVGLIDVHVAENETPASLQTVQLWNRTGRKSLLISTDGHKSCASNDRSVVEAAVAAFSAEAAAARRSTGGAGTVGIDLLVNSFLGSTHKSQDYDPRLENGWPGLWTTFRRANP